MSRNRRDGFVSRVTNDGLLFVVMSGLRSEITLDQRELKRDERFSLGDFITFSFVNGMIESPQKREPLRETRIVDGRLQIRTEVIFSTKELKPVQLSMAMIAWSPDFSYVGYFNEAKKPFRERIYMAWIERVENSTQYVGDFQIGWRIYDMQLLEDSDRNRRLLEMTPWRREKIYGKNGSSPDFKMAKGQRHQIKWDRRYVNRGRPTAKELKAQYGDNYEGLVTSTFERDAFVWSLAIPISDVLILNGAREGLKVGDWVQFNCEPSIRPIHNALLMVKKFTKIEEPPFPSYTLNGTVMVDLIVRISKMGDGVQQHSNGLTTLYTDRLGKIEFRNYSFRDDFFGKTLKISVYKDDSSEVTDAVWQFHHISDETNSQYDGIGYSSPSDSRNRRKLVGVIFDYSELGMHIWTKEAGLALWKPNEELPCSLELGTWASFEAIIQTTDDFLCSYFVVSEPVALTKPLLETRIKNGKVQIRVIVKFVRRDRLFSAYSDDIDCAVNIPDHLKINGSSLDQIKFNELGGNFCAWLQMLHRHQWQVAEITKKLTENEICNLVYSNSQNGCNVDDDGGKDFNYLAANATFQPNAIQRNEEMVHDSASNIQKLFGSFEINAGETSKPDPLIKPVFGGRSSQTRNCRTASNETVIGPKITNSQTSTADKCGCLDDPMPNCSDFTIARTSEILSTQCPTARCAQAATTYLKQIWDISEVRRKIYDDNPSLYANIKEMLTELT